MATVRVFVDRAEGDDQNMVRLFPTYTVPTVEIPPSIEISSRNLGQFDLEQLKSLVGRYLLIDYPAMKLIKVEGKI
jgi:hypothetical protein